MTDQNPYDFWQRALAGEKVGGPTLPVHDDEGHPGFWRKRTEKNGSFVPVATWVQDGKMVALVNGRPADPAQIWTNICRYPIPEEWYRDKMEGKPWPDGDEAVDASHAAVPPPARGSVMGDNEPPKVESLQDQIAAALKGVDTYKEIKDDETASKAQGLRSRLLDLSGDADKERDKLKRPHLDANKAIDATWMPLVKSSKDGADAIRKALVAHENRKLKAEEDARAAAVEAARLEALKASPVTGENAVLPVELPKPPEPITTPKTNIRGASGRAASIQMVDVVTVKDQDAAYGFLKTHPEMVDLIYQLSKRAVKAGHAVPGVVVTKERDVR